MEKAELKNFVLDVQNFGFTQRRKERLLQAVGRFCCGAAVTYIKSYGAKYEEFTAAAWLAIHEAIAHYQPEMEGGFLTLLAFWIRNSYNNVIYREYLNKKYGQDKTVKLTSIYAPKFKDGENDLMIIDTLKDESAENESITKEKRNLLNKITSSKCLQEKEKDVLDKLSFGYNLSEIAEIRGISKERVRQIRQNAIKKIKENLNTK